MLNKYLDKMLSDLVHTIDSHDNSRDRKIHHIRVTTKRLRSLWRLVGKNHKLYKKENQRLRRIAKVFAKERDQSIVRKIIKQMGEKSLAKKVSPHRTGAIHWHKYFRQIQRSAQKLKEIETHEVQRKLQISVEAARGELRKYHEQPSAKRFHRWRRRTKNLLYQRESMRLPLRGLKILSRRQGEAHDLYLVCKYLKNNRAKKSILRAASRTRQALEKQALGMNLEAFS